MLSCWAVTDGKAGTETQCLGLAQALGLDPTVKRIQLRPPWRQTSPYFRFGNRLAISPNGDAIAPPWPDLLIAAGRQSVAASLAVRDASRGRTFRIQLQSPGINPDHFDIVVVPRHDRLRGPNVLTTLGALHRVTPEAIAVAGAHFGPRLNRLQRPRVAVLIGGTSKTHRMSPAAAERLASELACLATERGAGLMITVSRRTGAENESLLRRRLAALPSMEFWDGSGENPYLGYLASADFILVTNDSVSMPCEAAATGKPIYILPLEGGSAKFERFHAQLGEAGIARPFSGLLENWTYPPLNEAARIATEVRKRLDGGRHGSKRERVASDRD
jgi:mitochondrial fission protein ELM1